MPIYEYKCEQCGECFEKLCLSANDNTRFDCPHCGSTDTQKLMSCASFMGGSKSGLCSSNPSGGFS